MTDKSAGDDLRKLKATVDEADAIHKRAYARVGKLVDACADPKEIGAAYAESNATAKAWSDAVTAYNAALGKLSDG